jgi:hypothetical protein
MSSVNGLRVRVPVVNPTEDATHIEVSVFYQKGGVNYVTSNREPGGIYVSVSRQDRGWHGELRLVLRYEALA